MQDQPSATTIELLGWLVIRPHGQHRPRMRRAGQQVIVQMATDALSSEGRNHAELGELEIVAQPLVPCGLVYLAEANPQAHADIIIRNDDPTRPVIIG